ncbi:MAG: response regulator [Nitrospirae bacterium]|nr:MAG: response regulator [Nitrospirota bacterium]
MSYKLLLADDSLTIQKVVELVLANESFEIKTTNDGEQALAAMGSFSPDIVLADIDMPKLNGYQLCEKLKKSDTYSRIPVILLAGAFEPFDEEYAKSVSADDFIIKPFESQELISKVKALLAAVPPAPLEALEEEEGPVVAMEEPIPEAPVTAEISDTSELEEPKWDEDVKIEVEEKVEGQRTVDEDFEVQLTLSGDKKKFEETLEEAIEQKEIVPQCPYADVSLNVPAEEQVLDVIRQEVGEKVSGVITAEAASAVSEAIRQTVSDSLPSIIEQAVQEQVKDVLSSLRGEIEAAINKHVPEIAEAIIRKEIEKISSEL